MTKFLLIFFTILALGVVGLIGYSQHVVSENKKIAAEAEKLKKEKLKEEAKKLIAKAQNADAKTLTEVGYAFKKNGDYNNAKKYFRLAAEKGNVGAMFGFAKLWRENKKTKYISYKTPVSLIKEAKKDGREIISWLEKARSNGATFDSAELARTQLNLSRFVSSADEKIKLLKKVYLIGDFLRDDGYEVTSKKMAKSIASIYREKNQSDKAAGWYDRAGEKSMAKVVYTERWEHFKNRVEEIKKLKSQGIDTMDDTKDSVIKSMFRYLIKASLLGNPEAARELETIRYEVEDLRPFIKATEMLIDAEGVIPKLED